VPDLPALGWEGALVRLAVAAALAGAIGLERELDEKSAGLRTHMLVAIGSALFTLVSAYGFRDFLASGQVVVRADPSRIAAQIVTGIGFLGAGVIFRQGASVRGLTTAASLWVVAAVGMAAGAGYWQGAVIATVAALLSLRLLDWVKVRALPSQTGRRLTLRVASGTALSELLPRLESLGEVHAFLRTDDRLEVELDIPASARADAVARAAGLPGVQEARWTG
jgi:putative Mg2+ transporter-C (MgtC) family protein